MLGYLQCVQAWCQQSVGEMAFSGLNSNIWLPVFVQLLDFSNPLTLPQPNPAPHTCPSMVCDCQQLSALHTIREAKSAAQGSEVKASLSSGSSSDGGSIYCSSTV